MINYIIKFTIHVKEGDLYCSDDVTSIQVVVPCVGRSKKEATKHLLRLKKSIQVYSDTITANIIVMNFDNAYQIYF